MGYGTTTHHTPHLLLYQRKGEGETKPSPSLPLVTPSYCITIACSFFAACLVGHIEAQHEGQTAAVDVVDVVVLGLRRVGVPLPANFTARMSWD